MSFKNNTALRTATIAASFLLTLLIAAFATGARPRVPAARKALRPEAMPSTPQRSIHPPLPNR